MEKNIQAQSFYMKIIEIWKKHILHELETEGRTLKEDSIYHQEAKEHLKAILVFFDALHGKHNEKTAQCNVAFALVMLQTGTVMVALEYLEQAYTILQNDPGEFDPKTVEVAELIKKIETMEREDEEGEMAEME